MTTVPKPLSRQMELAFKEVGNELAHLSNGTLFIFIRNNNIGKFGIRHFPVESRGGKITELRSGGLSPEHILAFQKIAAESLRLKKYWTHGEIQFDFAVRQQSLSVSVSFESNYNMSAVMEKQASAY